MLSFAMPLLQILIWSAELFSIEWTHRYFDYFVIQWNFDTQCNRFNGFCCNSTWHFLVDESQRVKALQLLIRFSTLGYALPGSVMAVGLLYGVQNISLISIYLGGSSINHILFGSVVFAAFCLCIKIYGNCF